MRTATCAVCAKLWSDSAIVLLEYDAALDALALTGRTDHEHRRRWLDFVKASARLSEALKLEQTHQDNHHLLASA